MPQPDEAMRVLEEKASQMDVSCIFVSNFDPSLYELEKICERFFSYGCKDENLRAFFCY